MPSRGGRRGAARRHDREREAEAAPARATEGLPPTLLLLALASVFVFGNDRSQFYRPSTHDHVSA